MSKRRQDSTDSSSKKGKPSLEMRVSLEDQIQFVGQYFTVTVLLIGMDGQLYTGDLNDITLKKPQLYIQNHNHQLELLDDDTNTLEIENFNTNFNKGTNIFQAKINTLSRDSAGKQYLLSIDTNTNDNSIKQSHSLPITIISYKLSLLSEIPNKWYNQMGGGGNCITLDIECKDQYNNLVTNKHIPLEIILVYSDDHEIVRTQEILTKSDDSQMTIINGKSIMKVRIEHVSRKHQNRLFAIKITPDLLKDPMSANVSSIISSPINVLSKITPRDRKLNDKKHINSTNSFDESSNSNLSNDSSSLTYPILSKYTTNQDNLTYNIVNNQTSIAAPISDEDDTPNYQHSTNGVSSSTLGAPTAPSQSNLNETSTPLPNGPPIVTALSNVLGWIDDTLKCLCDSKWQPIGFDQENGNISRPLYSMSNPNERIQSQLDGYRNKVMSSLSIVLEGIEPILEQHQLQYNQTNNHNDQSTNQMDNLHPEPLTNFGSVHDTIQPTLARSGSNGILGSADTFETLVNTVGHFESHSSDPMLPLLRGLSRGFSDFNGQI